MVFAQPMRDEITSSAKILGRASLCKNAMMALATCIRALGQLVAKTYCVEYKGAQRVDQ